MKYLLSIALLLLGVTGFAQNRSGTIVTGNTMMNPAMNFTAADTINEDSTYYIEIFNPQHYPQMQDVYLAGSAVSGSGDIVITVYGKKFVDSDYASIGTTTWNSTLALDEVISVTTVNRYRYLKVDFVSDATTKKALITNIVVKTWNTGGELSSSNLSLSGNLVVAGTSTLTGAVTANGGITLGTNDDLIGSATSDITIGTTAFTVAGATGDVGLDGTITFAAPNKLISAGSYASKLTAPTGSTTEWVTIGAEGTEDDFQIGQGIYLEMSGEDGKGFPLSTLVEATNTTGTPTLQGLQSMAFLGTVGGTEAAVLKTMGGDATAGMYGGWFKVGANTNTVAASGSRVAPLWVDNQMGGTVSGEEYGIFLTAGGTVPDAAFGFETTSSGWSQLFYFDETAYDQEPVSNTSLKVLVNATQYYLPMSTSNTLFSSAYGVQVPTYNFADATAVAGSADAITIDFTVDLTISTGTVIYFIAEAANTGAATLAIDGGSAIAIVESSDGSALESGDIPNAGCIQLMYDGTSWQQLSQSGN